MNHKDTILDTMAHSDLYRGYERAFGEATGLPLTLRTPDAWQVAQKDSRHQNPFCALMAAQSRSCAACLRVQQELSENASDKPVTSCCFAGLSDSAVPVRVGDKVIGHLQTGQVALKTPSKASFGKVRARLDEMGVPGDRAALEQAWLKSPTMTRRQYQGAVELLAHFATQLSAASNQLAIRQANAEPPSITRAKAYIDEHLSDDITLGDVAKAVHMSRFYFCKSFRKHAGLHFTDYVSRLRIERAKELLLNPHLRISEIAYEVGFQSLTHFNRVFRRILGKSPTQYRGKVAVG
ncbi:MAG: helix-turn-helix domain-containing protein [Verrucomicrobiota bacterium]|jgi:AraC-like DNA-binding protein/ligand-binding sensor protein